MTPGELDPCLEALKDSLAAKLPHRVVTRSLIDPAMSKQEEIEAGTLCLVTEDGGEFANYYGREGELGRGNVRAVGFLRVADDSEPVEIERAELAFLAEVLAWVKDPGEQRPVNAVYPLDFNLSKQLEHPLGWFTLLLDVRF